MSNEYTKGILTMSLPALNFPWKDLEELGTKMEFCRGTTIPCEKVRDYFYFLKKGRMSILYTASDRKVQTMVQMKSGTLFNVAHALCAKSTCFLDCCSQFYCTSDVTAFRYHYSLLYDEDFIRRYPRLISNLMQSLGIKLMTMHTALSQTSGSTLAKVGRFCLQLALDAEDAARIVPGISQAQMADRMGMHRTSLLRALRELRKRGVIHTLNEDALLIADMDALRRLAEDERA